MKLQFKKGVSLFFLLIVWGLVCFATVGIASPLALAHVVSYVINNTEISDQK